MESLAIKSGYLGGIEEIFKRKCAGIIIEMEAIMQDGVRMSMIDLFLEQGLYWFYIINSYLAWCAC